MNDQPKPDTDPKQEWIDPDDAPELTEEFFEHAEIWHGDKLIRPGKPRLKTPSDEKKEI